MSNDHTYFDVFISFKRHIIPDFTYFPIGCFIKSSSFNILAVKEIFATKRAVLAIITN
jgi:hypothetical protein